MVLKDKKIAILVEQMYQELEVWYPYFRFKEAGAEVYLVGPEKKEYKGKYGYPATPELTIDEVEPQDFDAVVIPGGFAPDYMRRVPRIIEFVREMYYAKKVVAAICHGGGVLASAKIIKGKDVTGFFAIKDDLENAGGRYLDQEVVRDKNIITSRKPEDLPAFCRTIISAFSKKTFLEKLFRK